MPMATAVKKLLEIAEQFKISVECTVAHSKRSRTVK